MKATKRQAELIEQLKRCEKPFTWCTDEEQEVFKLAKKDSCLFLDDDGSLIACTGSVPFHLNNCYRIRPDFQCEVEPDLPPRPTQELLDTPMDDAPNGVEIVGESPRLITMEDWGYVNGTGNAIHMMSWGMRPSSSFSGLRWAVRPKKPAVRPWGKAEWQQQRAVIFKAGGDQCTVLRVYSTQVDIHGFGTLTFDSANKKFTQLDDSPCECEGGGND